MGLLYPKNKFFVKVYQQNVLYFCRILGFFYIIVSLQKHTKVILFWYKCNTLKCFLHNQGNLIYFRIINILYMVFCMLRTASASDCRLCVLSSSLNWCSVSRSDIVIS